MKKRISFIVLLFLITFSTISFGNTLDLNLKSNKDNIKKGEKVNIIVEWKEGMQAADFSLIYDNSALKFLSSDIENFCKTSNNEIEVAWFSVDNTDKTSLNFEFEALKTGKTTLSTKINAGFADKDLNVPDNYNNSSIEINIKNSFSFIFVFIIILIIVIILFLYFNKSKKTARRKR